MLTHSTIATNGIELHMVQAGAGAPVVLCHGFPELWYSWRHQLPALAGAGYQAIAVDMRGYGDSGAPAAVAAYDAFTVAADLIGLLDELGHEQAVFVGHDWGADIVWKLALAHPSRVRAVVGMSVPFVPRAPAPPIAIFREHLGADFYMVWFQEPGVADAALAADVRRTLATTAVWNARWAALTGDRPAVPSFMSAGDLDVFVRAFARTGFTGGLNYYRNIDRNWELMEPYARTRVRAPALFVAGSRDPVARVAAHQVMDGWLTDLRDVVIVEGAGHWIQQERPAEVNAALLGFLAAL